MPTRINIQSSDGVNFKVDLDVAKKSFTIRKMLENLSVEQDTEEEEVKIVLPLPHIDAEVLDKVIDWCTEHKNDPEPEKEEESKDGERKQKKIIELQGWDKDFINTVNYVNNLGQSIIFSLILAANYLCIPGLVDLTTMEGARMIHDKTPEEIRELFKLENDLEMNSDQKDGENMYQQ